ncbi:DMT family transporter [Phyllobacterium pellucidum]|uniref:DMT family transporter n=1 Tax=Phyllobacterium pellucidum TaxID=2740464 RepID=UPI001D13F1FD|nr:DMT family transporter [Phyllobacterium sp. T1018]UGY09644.1 DMT family transporter [Phyllobacterium sp. T1018]
MQLLNSAAVLLVLTGAFLGLTLPFGKLAFVAGVAPSLWAFVISLGAGTVLLTAFLVMGKRPQLNAHMLRYYVITALVSYAVPNLMTLSAIPHLGSGYTGIMYTLSPVFTLLFSVMLKLRRPSPLGLLGILVGFVGAVIVGFTRGQVGQPAEPLWVAIGLLIPVLLALGNVYRTVDWPAGADPTELAAGSHLMTALLLSPIILYLTGGFPVAPLRGIPWLVVAQVVASACMFALYFRLQAVGGPVYLSQIGYVGAAVALLAGTLFLGEVYQLATWGGALIITIGVLMTTKAQRMEAKALVATKAA